MCFKRVVDLDRLLSLLVFPLPQDFPPATVLNESVSNTANPKSSRNRTKCFKHIKMHTKTRTIRDCTLNDHNRLGDPLPFRILNRCPPIKPARQPVINVIPLFKICAVLVLMILMVKGHLTGCGLHGYTLQVITMPSYYTPIVVLFFLLLCYH